MMTTHTPSLAFIALLGFCIEANAQELCPELMRLRSEVQQAQKLLMTVPVSERCHMYNRVSAAWDAIAQYANDNRESCHIAVPTLNDFERYYREALKARDNVCAGRPIRPYPPDIIRR